MVHARGPGGWRLLAVVFLLAGLFAWLTMRYIPNQQVGVIEKLWSRAGSVTEGNIIALDGEAGFQSDLLRGGLHFGYWRWQYRVHKMPLVTIPQGKIGYVYARDGEPLPPSQTLARVVACRNFQDARAFLGQAGQEGGDPICGQRGRQRAILREGVYAINPALFVVITEKAATSYKGYSARWKASAWPTGSNSSRPSMASAQWWSARRCVLRRASSSKSTAALQCSSERRGDHQVSWLPGDLHHTGVRSHRRGADREVPGVRQGLQDRRSADSVGAVAVGRRSAAGRGHHRHRDGPGRPLAGAGRDHRPGGRHRLTATNYHNNYQDPEAFLRAAAGAAGNTCR